MDQANETSAPARVTPPVAHRRTRGGTRAWDRAWSAIITVGGFTVIAAVLGICVYLTLAVVPLFSRGSIGTPRRVALDDASRILAIMPDEYQASACIVEADGDLRVVELSSGRTIARRSLAPAGRVLTAWAFDASRGGLALGLDDGSVILVDIEFEASILGERAARGEALAIGSTSPIEPAGDDLGGVVQRPNATDHRVVRPIVEVRGPTPIEKGSGPIRAIEHRARGEDEYLVIARDDAAMIELVRTIRPLGGGTPRIRLTHHDITLTIPQGRGIPDRLFMVSDGRSLLALWNDGWIQRYACSADLPMRVELAEEFAAIGPGRRVTAATMLLGGRTLLLGDDAGTVRAYFPGHDPAAGAVDEQALQLGHVLDASRAAITSLGISARDRTIAVGDAEGGVTIVNVLSEKLIARTPRFVAGEVGAIAIMPKLDGVLAVSGDELANAVLDSKHAEAAFGALFGKVHYEGASKPEYVYQSSSGEDAAEVKMSLVPLILGTLKATLFAMVFALPVAVMAAIYSSEFLSPRVRGRVKPVVEMMASLPSVVLGFIAATVLAPVAREIVPAILVGLGVVPLVAIVAGRLWLMLPAPVAARQSAGRRFALAFVVLSAGVAASWAAGPLIERTLFSTTREDRLVLAGSIDEVPRANWPAWIGSRRAMSPDEERSLRVSHGMWFRDGRAVIPVEPRDHEQVRGIARDDDPRWRDAGGIRNWLNGNIGTPFPGWLLLLVVPSAIAVGLLEARMLGEAIRSRLAGRTRLLAGLVDLARLGGVIAAAIAIAAIGAALLSASGWDSRDLVFGPFNQRNTLVVGIMMGFAIIPIIYTISEDAMASVPASLRSASLGAGATVWQTTVRVVLPVAASGIFSAAMIGLGRAVGETMIVVMATGNTPTMNWNIFEGFRTLSANIAVELPEASVGGVHYRVLFLCGLVLFAMTFIINTTTELLRQRVRRRNAAL